ncbi:hypothetical protein BST61_g7086 [Cercospora zeina]
MSNRAVTILGGTVLAGAGYYLYTAGGDPKVAQKQVEADAAKASREVKSHLPGSGKEAKKDAELYAKDAQANANKAIDQFDQKVSEGASKAKSGISSWFGGK